MERREFGTKTDKIDGKYPLMVAGKGILTRADLPADGLRVGVLGDSKVSVLIKRLVGGESPDLLTVSLLYDGIRVPGMSYSTSFPGRSDFKVFKYSGEVYKGVQVELEAVLSFQPFEG